ncbi:hypothetical protein 162309603 [Organic Lake phycodnavirus]|jgi:hypothetical protein|nr:hypothetical protein 162309603 [Organic Lake phycodnavirus]
MIVIIHDTILDVFKDGLILRKLLSGRWKEIKNTQNHNKGYNVILIKKKQYMRSSIIAHAFLEYNLYEKNHFISHIDLDRLNCEWTNLKLVPQAKNSKKLLLSREGNGPLD